MLRCGIEGSRARTPPSPASERGSKAGLHVATVFAAHVVQRVTDLSQAVRLHGLHQRRKHVLAVAGGVLQVSQAVAVVDEVGFFVGVGQVGVGGFAFRG